MVRGLSDKVVLFACNPDPEACDSLDRAPQKLARANTLVTPRRNATVGRQDRSAKPPNVSAEPPNGSARGRRSRPMGGLLKHRKPRHATPLCDDPPQPVAPPPREELRGNGRNPDGCRRDAPSSVRRHRQLGGVLRSAGVASHAINFRCRCEAAPLRGAAAANKPKTGATGPHAKPTAVNTTGHDKSCTKLSG